MRCYNEDLENHQEFCKAGKMLQPMSSAHAFPQRSIFESLFETASDRQHSTSIAPKRVATSGDGAASRRAKIISAKVRESKEGVRNVKRPESLHKCMSNLRVEDSKVCFKSGMQECDSPKRKKRPEAERRKADKVSDRRRRVPEGSMSYRLGVEAAGFAATKPESTGRQDKKLARKAPETNSKVAPHATFGAQTPARESGASKKVVPMKIVPVSPREPEYRSSRAPLQAASSIEKQALKSKRRKSSKCAHSASDQATLVSDSSASDLSKSSQSRRCREHAAVDSTRYFWKDPVLSRPTTPKGILKKSSSRDLRDCEAKPVQLELTKNHATTTNSDRRDYDTDVLESRGTRKKPRPRRRV
jgi:hypothetical protein